MKLSNQDLKAPRYTVGTQVLCVAALEGLNVGDTYPVEAVTRQRTPGGIVVVAVTVRREQQSVVVKEPAHSLQPVYIEAYGVMGMKSRPWRRTFKDGAALLRWSELKDAEVYGQRFVPVDERG
jgi:hypothetical protein